MKYLAVVILIIVMRWTWGLTVSEKAFSLADHHEVENVIRETITGYIKKHKPDTQNVVFQQLYTETVEPHKTLMAHFRYQIISGQGGDATEQTFKGHVTLNWNEETQSWTWGEERVGSTGINFTNEEPVKPEGK